jgi:hypothetical protein
MDRENQVARTLQISLLSISLEKSFSPISLDYCQVLDRSVNHDTLTIKEAGTVMTDATIA